MRRCFQADLWDRVTVDLHGSGDIGLTCKTKRLVEMETLFYTINEKFESTLDGEQLGAFQDISAIADAVRWETHDSGIALGMQISKEVRDFLERPTDALHRASASHLDVFQSHKPYLESLDKYFNGRNERQEQEGTS